MMLFTLTFLLLKFHNPKILAIINSKCVMIYLMSVEEQKDTKKN